MARPKSREERREEGERHTVIDDVTTQSDARNNQKDLR